MTKYSVKQLANLANISVRTLHHYDRIDLLKPSFRSEKGYRFYERKELLLLQQILFYRELGFALKDIATIIHNPSFDLIDALISHKKNLRKQLKTTQQILKTIDKTILELKNNRIMKDEEIYEGFKKETIQPMREEVAKRWGKDKLETTEARIKKMGKEGWNNTKAAGERVSQRLADLMHLEPQNISVQQAVEEHFNYTNLFYGITLEGYQGLGDMYVTDERFKAHYEKYKEGLAEFIRKAIFVYCENGLQVK